MIYPLITPIFFLSVVALPLNIQVLLSGVKYLPPFRIFVFFLDFLSPPHIFTFGLGSNLPAFSSLPLAQTTAVHLTLCGQLLNKRKSATYLNFWSPLPPPPPPALPLPLSIFGPHGSLPYCHLLFNELPLPLYLYLYYWPLLQPPPLPGLKFCINLPPVHLTIDLPLTVCVFFFIKTDQILIFLSKYVTNLLLWEKYHKSTRSCLD